MGAEGLIALLGISDAIDLVAVVEKTDLEAVLSHEKFKVLILPAGEQTDADYQHLLAARPDIGILVIDLFGPETIVRFRDSTGKMLVRVIKALSKDCEAQAGDSGRIHWLRNEDLVDWLREEELDLSDNAGGARSVTTAYPDAKAHLADVKRWLALSLQALIDKDVPETNGPPFPGWTMNAAQARSLLGEASPEMSPASLWDHIERRERASRERGLVWPLLRIADAFRLDDDKVEKQLVWHVLGPELDGRFARAHGYLNDDLTRRRPTLTRLAQLVDARMDAWSLRQMLAGARPLARHHLISVYAEHAHATPATEESVAPAPEIVRFLLKDGGADASATGATLVSPGDVESHDGDMDAEARPYMEALNRSLVAGNAPIFQLDDGREALSWFERNALAADIAVLKVDLGQLDDVTPAQFPRAAQAWARTATLHHAILLLTGFEQRSAEARSELSRFCAAQLPDLVPALVLHGASLKGAFPGIMQRPLHLIEHSKIGIQARAQLWYERAIAAGLTVSRNDVERLAATARFDQAQIDTAISIAKGLVNGRMQDPCAALCEAVRRMARDGAPSAVQLVECAYTWNDIVLPPELLAQIKSIPDQVRYAGRVLERWGYAKRMPYGRGVAALFSGPSGTGKSMAAQIIASDLCTALYRIDLSKTMSKWLGETEKILSQIFDLARQNSAVLLFDEADVLFAKRTEVKDAHDRYANVEVAYLLQRMEDYDGLAILTTNLKQNIDPAFLRRLRFVIDFQMPDADCREQIWKRAFPPQAPLAPDVDFKLLARRVTLAGGNIQQIAIRAAFAAASESPADENAPITMQHIVRATRQELLKLGMLNAELGLAEIASDRTAATGARA
jgi:hypothetical protein